MTPRNECGACGQDFTSIELFDRHRKGVHEYTVTEGLRLDPPREDGRRCLATHEMLDREWAQDDSGRWYDPARVERARTAFPPTSRTANQGGQ